MQNLFMFHGTELIRFHSNSYYFKEKQQYIKDKRSQTPFSIYCHTLCTYIGFQEVNIECIELLDSRVKASKSQCMVHSCRKRCSLQRRETHLLYYRIRETVKLALHWLKQIHLSISVAEDFFNVPVNSTHLSRFL